VALALGSVLIGPTLAIADEMIFCPPQVDVTLWCQSCVVPSVYSTTAYLRYQTWNGGVYGGTFQDEFGFFYNFTFSINEVNCILARTPWGDWTPSGITVTPVEPPWPGP